MSDMDKVAGQVPGIMQTAAEHMRKLAGQNVELVKRAEAAEHEVRLVKLARRMEQRGIEPSLGFDEKLAHLRSIEIGKIASLEQAVELAAGGFRLGRLEAEEKRASADFGTGGGELYRRGADGGDALEQFIESQHAYGG
jgi:hypothetical protein